MYSEHIPIREKAGYSLGDVAANLVFQMIVVYQLKFYTDVFGIEGALAGSILLIARVVDAFVDPVVGIMTDHTQTRWGKYRPWILWTALPFSVFYVLAFMNPGIEDKALLALYATVTHVLLMVTYSLNNTPYAALGGVMTGSISQRNSLNNIRFIGAMVAQIAVLGLTLPLVSSLGQGNEAKGWMLTISIFAVCCLVCNLLAFFTTRERITPPPRQQQSIKSDVAATTLTSTNCCSSCAAGVWTSRAKQTPIPSVSRCSASWEPSYNSLALPPCRSPWPAAMASTRRSWCAYL